ncbi:MAG: amidohydrolase [Acidobacteria bacterium]|nr:MAG: amidohydrolase [Acidobacteriota bacterium]PYV75194.1 MAG: amidohydrolase [Acidobacteriota bacterium]
MIKTKWFSKLAWLLLFAFFIPSLEAQSPQSAADSVLLHGRIYTLDTNHPWAEALAIRDGKILAVGSDREIGRLRGTSTQVIDAKGRLVLPGFTDCHTHFMEGSLLLQQIFLNGVKSIPEIQSRVKAYAGAHPNEPWLLGRGWNYPVFAPTGMPDKKYLDEIVRDRPVYLDGFDGHTWWANSKALEIAHISKDTPDPPGGSFVRDPKTGEPTGAIKEDAADAIIRRAIPEPSHEQKIKTLMAGIELANQFGITRVHGLTEIDALRDDLHNVDLIQELQREGKLTLRFYLGYRVDPPEVSAQQLREIVELRDRYHDDWIAAGAVKFFMDGVIETHTAAMLAPYSDDPSLSGQLFWDVEKYQKGVAELDRRGIQVFTHAIGDRAIRTALDAYENAAQVNGTKDVRHRIEHIEDVSADDIPRFGKLGVIASMQPLHAYPDDDTLKAWAPNVGPERAQRAWAWHSIQAAGGVLAFGSDWPVVTLSPWEGLQNAVTRQTTEGEPKGGWIPSERISLADAIKGYTLNAAFAGHREKTEGSLEAGKVADLIVLSQNIFKVAPLEIGKTKVLLTIVGGRVVYSSNDF